jgi:hypothetical protein
MTRPAMTGSAMTGPSLPSQVLALAWTIMSLIWMMKTEAATGPVKRAGINCLECPFG